MKTILFNASMVKAILAGRKTQTRREVSGGFLDDEEFFIIQKLFAQKNYKEAKNKYGFEVKYKIGDILYVRETFGISHEWGLHPNGFPNIKNLIKKHIVYKADGYSLPDGGMWKPSIHMPKEYARIFLKVTDMRVERLKQISTSDVQREGIREDGFYTFAADAERERKRLWISLWDSTAKDGYKWHDNPYVFVYEFERIEKPKQESEL